MKFTSWMICQPIFVKVLICRNFIGGPGSCRWKTGSFAHLTEMTVHPKELPPFTKLIFFPFNILSISFRIGWLFVKIGSILMEIHASKHYMSLSYKHISIALIRLNAAWQSLTRMSMHQKRIQCFQRICYFIEKWPLWAPAINIKSPFLSMGNWKALRIKATRWVG